MDGKSKSKGVPFWLKNADMNSKENKDYFAEWDESKMEETKQECKNEYSGGPDECGEKDLND